MYHVELLGNDGKSANPAHMNAKIMHTTATNKKVEALMTSTRTFDTASACPPNLCGKAASAPVTKLEIAKKKERLLKIQNDFIPAPYKYTLE